jgi:hypothetical protein
MSGIKDDSDEKKHTILGIPRKTVYIILSIIAVVIICILLWFAYNTLRKHNLDAFYESERNRIDAEPVQIL